MSPSNHSVSLTQASSYATLPLRIIYLLYYRIKILATYDLLGLQIPARVPSPFPL